MRKFARSCVAAAGVGFLLAAGVAAPSLAVDEPPLANPDGSSPNVQAQDGELVSDLIMATDAEDIREETTPWSCGLLRLDGSLTAGSTEGEWRVSIGASYDLDDGAVFAIPAVYEGWRLNDFTTFNGFGSPDDAVSKADMAGSDTYPAYTWMADVQERVVLKKTGLAVDDSQTENVVLVSLPEGMKKGEYVNFTLPMTLDTAAAAGDQYANAVASNTACAVINTPAQPMPKKVNSGGVDSGTSGIAALALGGVALAGFAAYGRRRARR